MLKLRYELKNRAYNRAYEIELIERPLGSTVIISDPENGEFLFRISGHRVGTKWYEFADDKLQAYARGVAKFNGRKNVCVIGDAGTII